MASNGDASWNGRDQNIGVLVERVAGTWRQAGMRISSMMMTRDDQSGSG